MEHVEYQEPDGCGLGSAEQQRCEGGTECCGEVAGQRAGPITPSHTTGRTRKYKVAMPALAYIARGKLRVDRASRRRDMPLLRMRAPQTRSGTDRPSRW